MSYAPKTADIRHHDHRGYTAGCRCKDCVVDHNVVDDLIVRAVFHGSISITDVEGGLNQGERLLLGELCVLAPIRPMEVRPDGRMRELTPGALYDRLMGLPRSSGMLPKGAKRLQKELGLTKAVERTKSEKVDCVKCGKKISAWSFKDGAYRDRCNDCKVLAPAGISKGAR